MVRCAVGMLRWTLWFCFSVVSTEKREKVDGKLPDEFSSLVSSVSLSFPVSCPSSLPLKSLFSSSSVKSIGIGGRNGGW